MEPEELSRHARALGLPGYRGLQVFHALQQEHPPDWEAVRALSASDRARLAPALPFAWPEVAQRVQSQDGTVRYLLRLEDGAEVESVYLPTEDFDSAGGAGARRRRATFCLSSQVGCAVNCRFCLTATLGLARSLSAAEIVAQVLTLLALHRLRPGRSRSRGPAPSRAQPGLGAGGPQARASISGTRAAGAQRPAPVNDRVNLVFMGMGEPFLNYENVVRAIRVLTRPEGAGLAPRRITVSTAGIVDKIRRWGEEAWPRGRPGLAISLNASSDAQRQALMPLHRGQGGMAALLAAMRALPLGPREYLTMEYVLLAGVNDAPADAARVLDLLRGLRVKLNLIAWNQGPALPFRTPAPEAVLEFQRRLIAGGLATYLRRPRGRDIFAACGQLARAAPDAENALLELQGADGRGGVAQMVRARVS